MVEGGGGGGSKNGKTFSPCSSISFIKGKDRFLMHHTCTLTASAGGL